MLKKFFRKWNMLKKKLGYIQIKSTVYEKNAKKKLIFPISICSIR